MTARSVALRAYRKTRDVLVPGLKHSQDMYEAELNRLVAPGMDWLDLGCGHHLLPLWRERQEREMIARCRSVVGIDYDLPSLKKHRSMKLLVRGDISSLPFPDASFDLVTANMVVEHLADPEPQFREIARVLRPGGHFIFHTPHAKGYLTRITRLVPETLKGPLIRVLDGRASEDVFPTHYLANTQDTVAPIAERAGLGVVKVRLVATQAVSSVVLPLAVVELLWIRLLLARPLRELRPNLIAVLAKPATAPSPAGSF